MYSANVIFGIIESRIEVLQLDTQGMRVNLGFWSERKIVVL